MFERFTDRARRVVVLAQEEARLLNHNYIGTEHILLGLIHEGEGVAAKASSRSGSASRRCEARSRRSSARADRRPVGHIPFTPRAKKVLELVLREALQLGHNYIGTEHILLGLIREGEGVAAQVLVKLGADLSACASRSSSSSRATQGSGQVASSGAGRRHTCSRAGVRRQGRRVGLAVLDQFGRNLTQAAPREGHSTR